MKTLISCAFLLGALFISSVAPAAGAGMKDGLWEITTSMEMPGMPYQPAPATMTRCYTKEDLKDDKQIIPKQDGTCKVTDMKHTGNKMTWKVSCTGDTKGTGAGEIVYRGDSAYDGFMKFEMEGMKMTSRYKAKRVGACK
jgi:hypothetical protein